MTKIHDTALISSSVKIGENVIIGPFCNIYGDVSIGDNVTLLSHISVSGHTTIGEGTKTVSYTHLTLPTNGCV